MSTIILAPFTATHAAIVHVRTTGSAIVSGKNEDGILSEPFLFQERPHRTDVVVDVGNHPEKVGHTLALLGVRRAGFHRRMHRPMRRVGTQVNKEWLFVILNSANEALRVIKKHIRAKTLHWHRFAIVASVAKLNPTQDY